MKPFKFTTLDKTKIIIPIENLSFIEVDPFGFYVVISNVGDTTTEQGITERSYKRAIRNMTPTQRVRWVRK